VFENTSDLQLVVEAEADGTLRITAMNQAYLETARQFGVNLTRANMPGMPLEEVGLRMVDADREILQNTLAKHRQVVNSGQALDYSDTCQAMPQGETLTNVLEMSSNVRFQYEKQE
jgi:hypothetical protein